jgi:amidohydrolase
MDNKKTTEELKELRRVLHRYPEKSGMEYKTAARIGTFLRSFGPDRIVENIGGCGLIAEFRGGAEGPTVLFRCELDALPIEEKNPIPYRSVNSGQGHLCGHDGHMTMVAGLAYALREKRPDKGRVLLLFQPSEENGRGAQLVIDDPAFDTFTPDYVFAIHNLPGYPLHGVVLSNGLFAAASRGMIIRLTGKTSHAAEPEQGVNPGYGMARMILRVPEILKQKKLFRDFFLATPIHARLGSLAYGTSPGEAVLNLTLRSYLDEDMDSLTAMLEKETKGIAADERLQHEIGYEEVFPATVNDAGCTGLVSKACRMAGFDAEYLGQPFRWSEDFGYFTARFPGALFGLGAGTELPALHNPDYDFPDALIPSGINLYKNIYHQLLDF